MNPRRYRLLIVDDSPEDRDAVRRALSRGEEVRFEFAEAQTGAAGLEACRAAPPDCLVLDYHLPDMDAPEFLAVLRGGRRDPPVPVVVITGEASEPLAVDALRAGAHDYVLKGAAEADVRRAVHSAMERHARLPERTYRVLIVDDSPEDRAAYRRRLGQGPERFEFREAETGAEGVALCREFAPDCVLLDFQLPDTDGLEVLAALAHECPAGDVAVLMLTGQGNESTAVRALKAGAEDYLVKGPALDGLPQAVRTAVEKVTLRRRLEEQRRELERSRNQLRVTLASIGDAVIATDPAGLVTFLNPVAERLTGWKSSEARGRPLREVFRIVNQDTRGPAENPAERALHEGTIIGLANHTVLIARDGTERPIDDSAAPIRDETGEVFGAVLAFRDVTDRKRLENELQRRVRELAVADRRKDEFLAMLAHELRNPLAPLRNSLHVLKLKGGDERTVDEVREVMSRQVGHLSRLVDDLLDVSRITQGKVTLKLERLDLARLVREAVADHRSEFEAARVELTVDAPETPVWVMGDATRLTQVVDNFLTNAVKFTNAGGRVSVTVVTEGNRTRLSVRDTGIGMEPEVLPTIFDVFAQADRSLDRSRGGMGLGLAIVKGLITLHGGTVTARSEGLGRGAEMVVELPLEQELPALNPRTGGRGPAPAERRRVLIIEDNRDSADSLKLLLEVTGYEVAVAHSGTDGIRLADAWRPSAVVCDIGLPGLDGFAVARRLREAAGHAGTRLIAVTGYGRDEDVARARDAGFDDYLVKPADPEKLLDKLARVDAAKEPARRWPEVPHTGPRRSLSRQAHPPEGPARPPAMRRLPPRADATANSPPRPHTGKTRNQRNRCGSGVSRFPPPRPAKTRRQEPRLRCQLPLALLTWANSPSADIAASTPVLQRERITKLLDSLVVCGVAGH